MTLHAPKKVKPTGGVKVDHASANKELRRDLTVREGAIAMAGDEVQPTDAEHDAELGELLGEIEDLVEQEVLEDNRDDARADVAAEQDQQGGTAPAEGAMDNGIDDAQAPPAPEAEGEVILAEIMAAAPAAEDATPEADGDDILAEIMAAANEQSDGDGTIKGAEDGEGSDGPRPANPDASSKQEVAEAAPAPDGDAAEAADISETTSDSKPASSVAAKLPAAGAKPAPGPAPRKGMLPPVRKFTTAPAAAAGNMATAKKVVNVKPAAVAAIKPGATASQPAAPVASKPATGAAVKPAAPKPIPAAKATAPAAAAAKTARPASTTSAAAPAAAKKPAAAVAIKPASGAVTRKPAANASAKPAAVPKVIQARLVPEDAYDSDDSPRSHVDNPAAKKSAAAALPAHKKAPKAPAEDAAGPCVGKKDAITGAAGAAAKKRVVTVGSKPSAACELFMAEHKQQLLDEGVDMAEAGEQAVKAWAALTADEKAEYEARAKEQAGDEAGNEAAPAHRKGASKVAKTAESGPKYYANGYMLFVEEQRPAVVAANPEAPFAEVGKLLGAEWRKLTKDEQEAINSRAKALNAESGAQPKPRKTKKKDDNAGGTVNAKKQSTVKPGKAKKVGTGRGSAGAHGSDDDDLNGVVMAAIGDAAGMEVDGDDEQRPQGTPAMGKKKRAASSSRKRSGKRARRGGAAEEAEEGDLVAGGNGTAGADSDDSDREDVDWEAHPAEAILAKTADGRYLVKRAGLGLDEYGIVNARAVKRQRLALATDGGGATEDGEEGAAPLPVSIAMVDEFEAFERSFWASVQDRSEGGDLDLDDLGEQSPLELCYYLGKLRESRMALHQSSIGRRDKDTMIRVPALRLSMAVQWLITLERKRADGLAAQLADAEARLVQYEGGSEAAAEEVEAGGDA